MRVCIIGWYGTETIGDRAILAGTLAFLSEAYPDLEVLLGSLYPFFTERTVAEDRGLWAELCGREVGVELFNSSEAGALKKAVSASDLLLVGGGPLMDLREMHMLAFAFSHARRRKVRTGVFGCGIGPLTKPVYKKAAVSLLRQADFAVFRDALAKAEAERLCPGKGFANAVDPAAYCATLFRSKCPQPEPQERIAINLRKTAWEYAGVSAYEGFEEFAAGMVEKVMADNEGHKVVLVPNHYFFFGGDDRLFLNTIKYRLGHRELLVQNEPLSLRGTMGLFAGSAFCIGMRFHAVVLMTLLNGRCRILNYTGAKSGKIRGYLDDVDPGGFFGENRMVSLDSGNLDLAVFDNLLADGRFEPPQQLLEKAYQTYRAVLSG